MIEVNSSTRVSTKRRRRFQAGRHARKTAGSIAGAAWRLALSLRRTSATAERQRSNRAAAADLDWFSGASGVRSGWAPSEYGEYYATSVSVYAAIKLRAEALGRPALVVSRLTSQGVKIPVGPAHPAQRLLDRVEPVVYQGRPVAGH